ARATRREGDGSFLISPPRRTRRSSTGKRSIVDTPSAPVTSADQNASTSTPIGVTAPAATTATGSARRGETPRIEEIEPLLRERADRAVQDRHPALERAPLAVPLDPDRRLHGHGVAAIAAEHAEGRDQRRARRPRQHERPERERRLRPEEAHADV